MNELINIDGLDVTLIPSGKCQVAGAWIGVGNVSLRIRADHERLTIDAYPLHDEMRDATVEMEILFSQVNANPKTA